jgi:hypothetical protein
MKFGTYLNEPKKAEGFDFFYPLKFESGRHGIPQPDIHDNIACFGDNARACGRANYPQKPRLDSHIKTWLRMEKSGVTRVIRIWAGLHGPK